MRIDRSLDNIDITKLTIFSLVFIIFMLIMVFSIAMPTIDKYKQDLAIEHGIKVIRIDCNYYGIYQRKDYITENIKKSEINSILDLSTVNYDEADIFALQPSYKRVCEMWDSGVHDLNEIAKNLFETLIRTNEKAKFKDFETYTLAEAIRIDKAGLKKGV